MKFTWCGKENAIIESMTPSTGTLRPDKESSKNWDDTENLYIEGDNLEVLKLLQKSYFGKVKMIYIDPPYNTGKDFIYKDNFRDSIANYKEITSQTTKANPETNGRYHTDWLNMIYPRLKLARNLLREDGVIFISIDDNEMTNFKKICDEVFGEDNFMSCLPRITKKSGKSSDAIAKNHDYVLMYSKSETPKVYKFLHTDKDFKYEDEHIEKRGRYKLNQTLDYDTLGYVNSLDYPIIINDKTYYPGNVTKEEYLKRKKDNPKDVSRW